MSFEYVISRAGNSMLLIDRHIFNKRNTFPKTGRISWRCIRRRNKEIACSSTCSTIGEEVTIGPTPHDPNCYELTSHESMTFDQRREKLDAQLDFQNNESNGDRRMVGGKFLKTIRDADQNGAINDCTISQIFNDSYNGDSHQHNSEEAYNYDEQEAICNEITDLDETYDDDKCLVVVEEDAPIFEQPRENVEQQSSASNVKWTSGISGNEYSIASPLFKQIASERNNHNTNPTTTQYAALDETQGFPFHNENNNKNNDRTLSEYYDLDSCSPEMLAELIEDMNELKRKERASRQSLARSREHLAHVSRTCNKNIQHMEWKARINEIEVAALKDTLKNASTENVVLRNMVDEMIKTFRN